MSTKHLRFAARLRELREESGVSMLELAHAIGVSDAAVCKWENGKAEPKIGYIIKLAEYFDCPIDYLLGIDGYDTAGAVKVMTVTAGSGKPIQPAKSAATVTLSDDEKVIISSYKKLTPKMRTILKETIDAWVDVGAVKPETND